MDDSDKSFFDKLEEMPKELKVARAREYIKRTQRVMNKGISDAKRGARLLEVDKAYNEALNAYNHFNRIWIPTVFNDPHDNFRLIERGVYFRSSPKVNFITDLINGFLLLNLPHTDDLQVEFDLISSLFDLLRVYSIKIINYFTIIDDYIFKYQPVNGVNLLYSPVDYFIFYDNNLWYKNYASRLIDDELPALLLISNNIPKYLFISFGLLVPNRSTLKLIFRYMIKEWKDKFDIYSNNHPVITYKYLSNYHYIEYIADANSYMLRDYLIEFPYRIRKYNTVYSNIKASVVPEYIAGVLYYLANGDIRTLNSIAVLVADLLLENNICRKLHMIITSSNNKNEIKNLIDVICNNKTLKIEKLTTILQQNYLHKIVSVYAYSNKAIIATNSSRITDSSMSKLLKRIISGKEVTIKDSMMGRISYSNKLSIVTFADRHDIILNYTNNFPTNIINLSHISNIDEFLFENKDLDWIRIPLALYGLSLIENRNKFTPIKIDRPSLQDTITKEFFTVFCSIKSEHEVYASELYKAYTQYYDSKFNDSPLSRISFIKSIKKLLETVKNSGKVKYYRPHHNRDNNAYAFQGLFLDLEKLNTFIKNNNNKQPSTEFKIFYEYLLQMNMLIPEELLC